MHILPIVGKAKRPKFELHLKIYDLNNVPLVSGNSFIKWHLAGSIHAEHRGRTAKCPISNHHVDYSFSKVVPSIRISIDKNNNLTECPLELEILQEFAGADKITLGYVKLNLSEYVTDGENSFKEASSEHKKRRSHPSAGPTSAPKNVQPPKHDDDVEGIVRRYLMQDSKVNSTLKIGIHMVQLDGERNFLVPSLKIAPVFGSISGLKTGDQAEDDAGSVPNIAKSRDTSEVHDLYRRTLAAYWSSQPNELPADECIEDIFSGGNGWKTRRDHSSTSSNSDETEEHSGTLRPSDFRRMTQQYHAHPGHNGHHGHYGHHGHQGRQHQRTQSASSDKSVSTVTGGGNSHSPIRKYGLRSGSDEGRDPRNAGPLGHKRSTSSLKSVTPTLGSDTARADVTYKTPRELTEVDVRDDYVAWKLPGGVATYGAQ